MKKTIVKSKDVEPPRSLLRMFFWEALGAAWFVHVIYHPIAHEALGMTYFYAAVFFLAAYPLLYIYRWKLAGGFLDILLWPLSFILGLGLGVSAYLCIAYWLYFSGNPYSYSLIKHFYVLGPLFVFIYYPVIQPFWGVTKRYYSLPGLFVLTIYAGFCGFLGFLVGYFLDQKIGYTMESSNSRFVLWLLLMFLGTAIGGLAAQKRTKE
jgi:hypothetical protein